MPELSLPGPGVVEEEMARQCKREGKGERKGGQGHSSSSQRAKRWVKGISYTEDSQCLDKKGVNDPIALANSVEVMDLVVLSKPMQLFSPAHPSSTFHNTCSMTGHFPPAAMDR